MTFSSRGSSLCWRLMVMMFSGEVSAARARVAQRKIDVSAEKRSFKLKVPMRISSLRREVRSTASMAVALQTARSRQRKRDKTVAGFAALFSAAAGRDADVLLAVH